MIRNSIKIVIIFAFSILVSCKSEQKVNSIKKEVKSQKVEVKKKVERDLSIPLIDQVDVNNPEFRATVPKEAFTGKPVFLGTRTIGDKEEDIKLKLFMWEDKMRGYFQTFMGRTNIQIFGYIDGTNIALKSKNSEMPQESGATLTGTLIGDKLDLVFKKGAVGEDAIVKMELTDVEYPLLFYRTEDLEYYGNKNK